MTTLRALPAVAATLGLLAGACSQPLPTSRDPLQETLAIAEFSDPVAQTVVGNLYEAGAFGAPDPRTAALWYGKAVRQGDALAAFHLAVLLEDGRGVAHDYPAAALFYRRAAQAGHGSAAFKLGYLYEKGLGVEQDFLEARAWYDIAQQGWRDAGINPLLPAYLNPSANPEAIDTSLPVALPPGSTADPVVINTVLSEPVPYPPAASTAVTVPNVPTVPALDMIKGHHVHLGSEKSVAAAMAQWDTLRVRFADLLGDFALAIAKLQLAGGLTYYQILVGPLMTESDADILCALLLPQGQYCNLIPPTGLILHQRPSSARTKSPRPTRTEPASAAGAWQSHSHPPAPGRPRRRRRWRDRPAAQSPAPADPGSTSQ